MCKLNKNILKAVFVNFFPKPIWNSNYLTNVVEVIQGKERLVHKLPATSGISVVMSSFIA